MSEIITVTGTVEEIIYSNPDNGYSVVGIDSIEEGQFTATDRKSTRLNSSH